MTGRISPAPCNIQPGHGVFSVSLEAVKHFAATKAKGKSRSLPCAWFYNVCVPCVLQEAVKQFAGFGDPSGIGLKLMEKMGFGAAEGSKGGLGLKEQV